MEKSDRIVTGSHELVSSSAAEAEAVSLFQSGLDEMSDAAARTIASWWQSPGRVGRAMAELATTGSVEVSALLDDIHATRPEAIRDIDRLCLDMLATWAINHPSREVPS